MSTAFYQGIKEIAIRSNHGSVRWNATRMDLSRCHSCYQNLSGVKRPFHDEYGRDYSYAELVDELGESPPEEHVSDDREGV